MWRATARQRSDVCLGVKRFGYFLGLVLLLVSGVWGISEAGRTPIVSWWPVVAATALQLSTILTSASVWRQAVRLVAGVDVGLREALRHVGINLVGKYLPGKVWGFAMRHQSLRVSGRSHAEAAGALALEQASLLISALALSMPSVLGAVRVVPDWMATELIAVISLIAASVIIIFRRQIRPVAAATLRNARHLPRMLLLNLLQWLIAGACLVLVALALGCAIDGRVLVTLMSAVPAAVVAGMLAVFAPGGLGVREGALVLLCGPVLGVAPALACAIWLRVVATVRDLLCGFAVPLLRPQV